MRIPIRSRLRLVALCLVVGLVTLTVATVQPADASSATPPVLVSFSASPTNVTAGSSVTFTWQLTSEAGVWYTGVEAYDPNGNFVNPSKYCNQSSLTSGTEYSGTYQETCTIPTGSDNGTYTTQVQVDDNANNVVFDQGATFTLDGTTTTLMSSINPSGAGESVNFSAVIGLDPGTPLGTPTGTVTFSDGTTTLCGTPISLSGAQAICTTSLQPGTHSIVASYSGDSNYGPSVSSVLSQSVNPATPSTPTITNIPGSGVAIYGGSFVPTVSTTAGDNGTTSVTSSTLPVCTVSSGTVNYVGTGTCTLTAHVAAGTNYGSADGTSQSFTVSQPRAITSADTATAYIGTYFSLTVTTAGSPVLSITKKGALPKHVTFISNGNGTATIFGTAKKAGVYHIVIKVTFGTGKKKDIVTQAFTLTVDLQN
jgi:Big-like domain-containing protein